MTSVADHTNRSVSYSQDASGNLTSVMDLLGHEWTYEYDNAHRLLEVIDPDQVIVVRNEFDEVTEYYPQLINFNDYTMSTYSYHDGGHTNSIEDDGATMHITGHIWEKIPFPYVITSSTVLEFDYKSTIQGSAHGIGFDINNSLPQPAENWRCLKLWGTRDFGNTTYNNYGSYTPEWQHYVIPVGYYFSGQQAYMLFFNDDDVDPENADGYFRNVQVYESTGYDPITFNTSMLTNYSGQDGTHSMTIEDNGLTLHLTGNTWKKMPVNYTLTDDTVLEFDFQRACREKLHGIGFDTDDSMNAERTFELYGSEVNGNTDFNNDYDAFAPEWKHYIIPVGTVLQRFPYVSLFCE